MSHVDPTYRYLNLEGAWPLVQRDGLVVGSDGSLSLATLPALAAVSGASIPDVEGLVGPFGIGAAQCGDLYVADPAAHRILRVDACDGSVAPLPCFGGLGSAPGQLDTPRGVAVSRRGILLVADSGNHRIQLVDLRTGQLRGVWQGGFAEPWDLAVDSAGAIYVADAGTLGADGTRSGGTIIKLSDAGVRDAGFASTLSAQPQPGAPVGVAIAAIATDGATSERLIVLDAQPPLLLVYALDGTIDSDATERWSALLAAVVAPVAVTASSDRLYVADAEGGRVLVFDHDGNFLGVSDVPGGGVAGLTLDCHGRLVAHPGAAGDVQLAGVQPAYAECGTFLAGPFEAPSEPTRWWQLRATLDALAESAHVRFFTYTSDTMDGVGANVPALPAACTLDTPEPSIPPETIADAPIDAWRAAPWDAPELLILNAPSRWVWIAGILQGDGTATPVLRQIRLDFDVDGWMRHLPAIFSRDHTSRVFLERTLALLQVPFDDEAWLIDDIALLIDPFASHDAPPHPTWLEWLAGWVESPLEESWDASTRRQAVADAFARFATRGTKDTIRRLVALHTGATPRIQELFTAAGPWSLGGALGLGFDTTLSPEPAEGAVLGTTAIVEHSRLLANEHHGVPVFEDVAHRFLVWIYSADLSTSDAANAVRRVLDREKPAHTTYELCVIEPRMRVGLQALIGIDAIVGGPPLGAALDGTRALGMDSVLPGPDPGRLAGGVIGNDARVGTRATLA